MVRTLTTATLATMAALAGGCGTMQNVALEGPSTHTTAIYGGVQRDVHAIRDGFDVARDAPDAAETVAGGGLGTLAMFDLVFSAVGDTLTLPLTIPMAMKYGKGAASAPAPAPGPPATGGPR